MSMGVLLHICFAKMSAAGVAQSLMRKRIKHFAERNVRMPTTDEEQKLNKWRDLNRHHLCCDKAKPGGFCVCLVHTVCEEHGERHVGTND